MEQIRSFIAVELPGELKLALARLQDKLKSGSRAPVKWVDPDSVHLTLKFLGNIDSGIVSKITSILEEAVRGTHPFSVEVSGLGVFPNIRRVQVVWVGLTGEVEKFGQLQQRIETGLIPLGFAAESRSFTPHLTVGRVRDYVTPDERQNLGQLVTSTVFEAKYKVNVDAVHLIKSQLTREGPIYSKISTVALR
jgi:2'-5' RNA ligase